MGLNCEPPKGTGVGVRPGGRRSAGCGPARTARPLRRSLKAVEHNHLVRDHILLLAGGPSC